MSLKRHKQPFPNHCRSGFARPAITSGQYPAHAGDPRADRGLVDDDSQGETHQDRREGRKSWPLRRLPDDPGRHSAKSVRRYPNDDRRASVAADHVGSVRRLFVTRFYPDLGERCVLMESSSSKSPGGTAVAAARPSSCGSVELSAAARPCRNRPIGGNFRSDREPSSESRVKALIACPPPSFIRRMSAGGTIRPRMRSMFKGNTDS